jgi:hypothetical protein
VPARVAEGVPLQSVAAAVRDIADAVRCASAVLDGEVCCLEPDGRTNFYRLMFRRDRPFFYAFDVLAIDGQDLTMLPLRDRKRRLRAIAPRQHSRLLHVDAIAERGTDLFRLACKGDVEGIVAKWAHGTYQCDGRGTSWLKIKNPQYFADGRKARIIREPARPSPPQDGNGHAGTSVSVVDAEFELRRVDRWPPSHVEVKIHRVVFRATGPLFVVNRVAMVRSRIEDSGSKGCSYEITVESSLSLVS